MREQIKEYIEEQIEGLESGESIMLRNKENNMKAYEVEFESRFTNGMDIVICKNEDDIHEHIPKGSYIRNCREVGLESIRVSNLTALSLMNLIKGSIG